MFKRFGIDGPVLKRFRSYLNGRTQRLSAIIDNIKSTSKDLFCGVPQGDKDQFLGLYSIYCTLHLLEILSEVMAWTFTFAQMARNYILLLSQQ